jgi:hypothetical protein
VTGTASVGSARDQYVPDFLRKEIKMKRITTAAAAAGAASMALALAIGASTASAAPGAPDKTQLKASCVVGETMSVKAAPKGTVQVDYWSGYTLTSVEKPRYAVPTYGHIGAGDWVYAFAMDKDGYVLAQNMHVLCTLPE